MKKFFGLIFLFMLVVSFTACTNSTDPTSTTQDDVSTTEQVTHSTNEQTTDAITTQEQTTQTTASIEAPTSTLVSIEVGTNPTKVVYNDQETFDSSGLVIMANYSWSNNTTTQVDVTSSVTFDKTTLDLLDDEVIVTYIEGDATLTTSIPITVNPTGELFTQGITLTETPSSDIVVTTPSADGDATSYWFAEYKAETFYVKAIVLDDSISEGSSIYNADGIELYAYVSERNSGIIDGTLNINASVAGEISVRVSSGQVFAINAASAATSTVSKLSFDGRYVAGYQIEIEIPYSELGLSGLEKVVSFVPGTYNNEGAFAQMNYSDAFNADTAQSHTYIHVVDDNTFAQNPWFDLGYTDGWTINETSLYSDGFDEQSFNIEGAVGSNFATSLELNVPSVLNGDAFPKVGIALIGETHTVYFFIDVNATLDNYWGNYSIRPNDGDWDWAATNARQFKFLGDLPYNNTDYKTLEIVRIGTSIYFISDGRIVQYAEGIFAEDESTQLAVMGFNMEMNVRNINIYTDTDFDTEIANYQIAAKAGSVIDGDLSDWDSTVLSNPFNIYGTDGRIINVYSYLAEDGIYIAYNAFYTNDLIDNAGNWWDNTNIEFKLGLGAQRYSAANGFYSRFESWGGNPRDVGYSVWLNDDSGALNHSIVELFIPWGMIEGYDSTSGFVPAGFAWKNPGELGNIWDDGNDFWYLPEADPDARNVMITETGVYRANDLTIDGDLSDWDSAILGTAWTGDPGDGRIISSVAFVGTDGFYGAFQVTTPTPLDLNTLNTGGDWWQNPNMEIWTNDVHSRIMFYDGMAIGTGVINQVAYTYDSLTNTLTVEFFIPFNSLGLTDAPASIAYRIGSNSLNGGWFMPVDPNQDVTANGLPIIIV